PASGRADPRGARRARRRRPRFHAVSRHGVRGPSPVLSRARLGGARLARASRRGTPDPVDGASVRCDPAARGGALGRRLVLSLTKETAMKLVRFGPSGAEKPGLIDTDGKLRDLSRIVKDITPDVLTPAGLRRLRAASPARLPLVKGRSRLGCPLTGIGKIVCIGLNYTDHALEVNLPLPKEPTIFIKANSAIAGPHDPTVRPRGAVKLDYEVELVAVIGKDARHVDEAEALRHVVAYCIMNDVSE